VKYCPNKIKTCVSSVKKENKSLDSIEINRTSVKASKEVLDKTTSLDLVKNIEELKVQIRSLENEKMLGKVIKIC
jgi:hypothetical protein